MSDVDPAVDLFVKAALGKKASGLVVLDMKGLTSIADIFIICSGRSNRQVSAIADHIQTDLKEKGIRPLGIEGMRDGHWVLLDYGYVVFHVFYEPIRSFYNLEGLWADAVRIQTPAMLEMAKLGNTAEADEDFDDEE